MTDNLSERTKELINQQAPWRAGVAWWVVFIQGVLALALGIYILLRQDVAGPQAVQFLGIYLLIVSIIGTISGVRFRIAPRALPYHMLAAGIGLATGTIISLDIWQDFMTATAALVIVSVGLLLYGIVGVLEWFLGGDARRSWLSLSLSVVEVVLGAAVLWSRLAVAGQALMWTGVIATVAGVALIGYAYLLYSRGKEPKTAQPTAVQAPANQPEKAATVAFDAPAQPPATQAVEPAPAPVVEKPAPTPPASSESQPE